MACVIVFVVRKDVLEKEHRSWRPPGAFGPRASSPCGCGKHAIVEKNAWDGSALLRPGERAICVTNLAADQSQSISVVMKAIEQTIESELIVQESATRPTSLKHCAVKIAQTADKGAKAMIVRTFLTSASKGAKL